ncbi:MAG: HDIG domain-containing protein [Alicyclobacillaceae bacterium]|nr:HDIG domain-containing protein [Alicyclobacillaceae bacterium]
MVLNRESAWALLTEYTQNPNLIKHALAVEAAMRAYARKFGEDEEKWGITGLLHDFDYEKWPSPEDHPRRGAEILRGLGYPEDVVYAILSHADYLGLPRKSPMDKCLYACDELCGFITAVALVRPTKSIHDVDVRTVKKKLKEKAFAKGVNREDVRRGIEELGVDPDEHISFVIGAMQGVAKELGLEGEPGAEER